MYDHYYRVYSPKSGFTEPPTSSQLPTLSLLLSPISHIFTIWVYVFTDYFHIKLVA